jgi:SSS family solute:Na+ symporter
MNNLDYSIVLGILLLLTVTLCLTQRLTHNAIDFLVANRCAGRYLLTISRGMAGLGAITVIAYFEQIYASGFSGIYWDFLSDPVGMLLVLSGWVAYRFRETRCVTLSEFFQKRYGKKFGLFSGCIGWLAGMVGYSIFPSVSANFFITFCQWPAKFQVFGLQFDTYFCVLFGIVTLGICFAIFGGQISIMVTDFAQGIFCNISFIAIFTFLASRFRWDTISSALVQHSISNPNGSLVNPFATKGIVDFNYSFFIIGIILMFIRTGTWQNTSAYAAAAKSPHEAKMARCLGTWRGLALKSLFVFIPICAVAFFTLPAFSDLAADANKVLENMNPGSVSQARIPLFLIQVLPHGLIGIFASIMMVSMISTDDTCMHSWGSILVNDIVKPLLKEPLSDKQQLWLLRSAIVAVGILTFCMSFVFKHTEYIILFVQISGAIFAGGASAAIIGGLYTRGGTALGAWGGMITGSTLSLVGITLQQTWRTLVPFIVRHIQNSVFDFGAISEWLLAHSKRFPLNGQIMAFYIIIIGFCVYFLLSYMEHLIRRSPFYNLQKLLHRGEYDNAKEHVSKTETSSLWHMIGVTNEFTLFDRLVFLSSVIWTLTWFMVFVLGLLGHFYFNWNTIQWIYLWKVFIISHVTLGVITTIWFLIGGIHDLYALFKHFST